MIDAGFSFRDSRSKDSHVPSFWLLLWSRLLMVSLATLGLPRSRATTKEELPSRDLNYRSLMYLVYMYLYICMYIYIYVYTYIYMYIYIHSPGFLGEFSEGCSHTGNVMQLERCRELLSNLEEKA